MNSRIPRFFRLLLLQITARSDICSSALKSHSPPKRSTAAAQQPGSGLN